MCRSPLVVKTFAVVLPRVTPSSLPPLLNRVGVLTSVLITVPPVMLPLKLLKPPAPKSPELPTSSTLAVLSSVPATSIEPPVRLSAPDVGLKVAGVKPLLSLRVPPLRLMTPVFAQVPTKSSVPTVTLIVPVLFVLVMD